MIRARNINQFQSVGDHSVMVIQHKGIALHVEIDNDDIPLVKQHRWSIGADTNGYLFVQSSVPERGYGRWQQRTIRLGRFLLNAPDNIQVDHRDRNSLNFRRYNLRLATPLQNAHNKGVQRRSRTGHRGVTLWNGKYTARVGVDGKMHHLGTFETIDEAVQAVRIFRGEYTPFYEEDKDYKPSTSSFSISQEYPYTYRFKLCILWGPDGSPLFGQRCRLLARGALNSRLVEFENGDRHVVSGNALRKA